MTEQSETRAQRAKAIKEWAERVDAADLREADTQILRLIAELAECRDEVDGEFTAAVRSARRAQHSWSEIGRCLGVEAGRATKVRTAGFGVVRQSDLDDRRC